ncbi:MAG TPA: LuxR C-terminal-related transcriptional regulator [Chloroflexota bacterium]|nr:LuxR C-terminal-related transcriptional regulator [Chloroflexota bacterium]
MLLYNLFVTPILLHTKLLPPQPRPFLIHRAPLWQRLAAGQQGKLTLISAPAGFGKTTLIAHFITHLSSPDCYGWLSLDEGDNDPTRFFTYVGAALQTAVPTLTLNAASLLTAPQPPPLETILTLLCNELSGVDGRITLVLDDYHLITNPTIHQALTFWLDHLPPNLHLILTTRADPPLPLARLRVRDELAELRAADLRFSAEEAAAFLHQVLGIHLSLADVAALEQRTEGWIAGLQLAALSMRGRDDVTGFVQVFSGSHAYVLDYLADEVLRQQPEDVLRFLQETAVLDHLSAPLCTAVTGRADSAALLRQLYQSNLFLEALDDHREWFRFHALFRDVLRVQLQNNQPERISELHGRASEWYAQSGQITLALHHALAAHDHDRAADLVEQHAWAIFERGEMLTVRAWLDMLPPSMVQSRPWLALIQASILLTTGQLAAATQAITTLQARPDLPADAAFAGELAHLCGTLARFQGDSQAAIGYARQAHALLPAGRTSSHAAALLNLAMATIARGDTAAANQALMEATAVAPHSQIAHGAWLGLAWLYVRQGRLAAAAQIYRQTIEQITAPDGRATPTSGAAYVGLAEVYLLRYELAAAQAALQTGVTLLRGSIEQILLALAYGRLAQVEQALGHSQQANAVLAEADAWLAELRLTDLGFGRIIAGYRAWLALRQGDRPAASRWADSCGLLPDMQLNSISELLYPLLARVLLANGRAAAAQSILDVMQEQMMARQWPGQLVEIYLLQALAHHRQRHPQEAQAALTQALTLAAAEGCLFWFVDEGAPLADLLAQVGDPLLNTAFGRQVQQLLAQHATAARPMLPDALSERELEVLRLVAAGATNQAIADRLVIALPTVKKHMSNIFSKLNAANRTQAIAHGRELGLL